MIDYGIWIPLEMTPQEHASVGVPKIGDIVKLEYLSGNPQDGTAKRVKTYFTDARQYVTKEYGGSFIYTANLI